MPLRVDVTDDRFPKLNGDSKRIPKLKFVDDCDGGIDVNVSAKFNCRDSLDDERPTYRGESRRSAKRNVAASPTGTESSVSSTTSVKSNTTLSIEDYEALKMDPSSRSTYRASHTSNGGGGRAKGAVTMEDIIKTLEDDPTEVAMNVNENLSDADLNALYKEKIARLTHERDSASAQAKYQRQAAESAHSELAAERVKCGALGDDNSRLKQKLKESNADRGDQRCDVETQRQNVARLNALVSSLQERLRDTEERADNKETSANRNELATAALRKELQGASDKRHQLEVSLKHHIHTQEDLTKKADSWQSEHEKLTMELCSLLDIDTAKANPEEAIVAQTSEILRNNLIMSKKLEKVVHSVQSSQLEAKASRETIMRLVADVNKEQRDSNEARAEMDSVKRERDLSKYREVERDAELTGLRDQLDQSQTMWTATRKELEQKIEEIDRLDHDVKEHEKQRDTAHTKLLHFRRHLASLLTDELNEVRDDEEMILQHVKEMQVANRKLANLEEKLSSKLKTAKEEMSNRKRLQQSTLQRANAAEDEYQSLEERICAMEGELLATDVDRTDLREERRKYMTFLDTLARAMKLDTIAMDAGFDLTADAIITRAEQLVKADTEKVQDRTHAVYNLQRKVKQLNEKMESKELHLNVSKKKCTELEEILKDKSRAEVERDDSTTAQKKLRKQLDRTTAELHRQKEMVVELKASLNDLNDLKVVNVEQKRMIDDLESSVNRLAKSKYKTSKQLKGAQEKIETSTKTTLDELDQSKEQLASAQQDTQRVREELSTVEHREKQLLEFRDLLASLVGLEVASLAVPDYEIMARVESLVKAHQSYVSTSKSLAKTLGEMDTSFGAGAKIKIKM